MLRGRISLVGPCLRAPAQIAGYSAAAREWLLAIRPGITGLATLEFKGATIQQPGRIDLGQALLCPALTGFFKSHQSSLW